MGLARCGGGSDSSVFVERSDVIGLELLLATAASSAYAAVLHQSEASACAGAEPTVWCWTSDRPATAGRPVVSPSSALALQSVQCTTIAVVGLVAGHFLVGIELAPEFVSELLPEPPQQLASEPAAATRITC